MTVYIGPNATALRPAEMYGIVTQRRAVFSRVGGPSEYTLSITAGLGGLDRLQALLGDEYIGSYVSGYLHDDDTDWHGRIVAIDLRSGYQNYRISGVESGDLAFANVVRVQYAGGSYQSATDTTSTAMYGSWQKMIIDDALTSAEATELADSELQRYSTLKPFPTSSNNSFLFEPSITITAIGHLAYEFRTPNVGDGTYGTDITGLSDQQISTVLDAIITNDTGLTVGAIATNTDTVSTAELDGLTNNYARIEYLVNRANSNGSVYRCWITEGLVFHYEAISADQYYTIHNPTEPGATGFITAPGGSIIKAEQARPGNWRDGNTGYSLQVDEIEIVPGAPMPRFVHIGYEAWGSMGGGSSSAPAPGGDNSNQIPDGGIFIPGPTGNRWPGYRVPMSERGG